MLATAQTGYRTSEVGGRLRLRNAMHPNVKEWLVCVNNFRLHTLSLADTELLLHAIILDISVHQIKLSGSDCMYCWAEEQQSCTSQSCKLKACSASFQTLSCTKTPVVHASAYVAWTSVYIISSQI